MKIVHMPLDALKKKIEEHLEPWREAMDEKDRKIQELTEENVRLRNRLAEAIGKACFNCEEYQGHDGRRCDGCPISRMKSMS